MNKIRTNLAFLIIGLLVGSLVYTAHADTLPDPAPFDHSTCQYPYRLSNPPDGCDNTDLACGEMGKGADHCFADEPKTEQVQSPQAAAIDPQTSQPPQTLNKCGGK